VNRSGRRLHHDERGVVGGLEILPFGVLIFVTAILLIVNVWAVVDAKMTVEAAAREAGRAYVEAPDGRTAAAQARAAAEASVAGSGRDPTRLGLRDNHPAFERCAVVEHDASYSVPAITLPFLGGFGHGFTVHGHHREAIDAFRGGLDGGADCG
jgi:hypothetical protein